MCASTGLRNEGKSSEVLKFGPGSLERRTKVRFELCGDDDDDRVVGGDVACRRWKGRVAKTARLN